MKAQVQGQCFVLLQKSLSRLLRRSKGETPDLVVPN
jgi:hypothetical protein